MDDPSDTAPEAERILIELARQATPERKWHLLMSWSRALIQANRETLRRLHPEASEDEIGLLFVANHYGKDLADQVRAHLAARRA